MDESPDVEWRPDDNRVYPTSEDTFEAWPKFHDKDSIDVINNLRHRFRLGLEEAEL